MTSDCFKADTNEACWSLFSPLSHTRENGCVCKVRAVRCGVYMSWSKSCVEMSRLFAVVAETAVHMLFPCLGGLLNLDLTNKYFRPKRFMLRSARCPFLDLHTIKLESVFVVGNAPQLLQSHEVRLCLLEQNHVEGSHHAVSNVASLWCRVPVQD